MDIVAELEGAIADTTGAIADAAGATSNVQGAISNSQTALTVSSQFAMMAKNLVTTMKMFAFAAKVAIIGTTISVFFKWIMDMVLKIPDIVTWCSIAFTCGIKKIFNLPQCFLWYFIEMFCWVIYLPFRLIFWIIDGLTGSCIVKMEHDLWCYLDDLDKMLYEKYEFHIIHYQDQIMKQCYSCQIPKFPVLPDFPKSSINNIQKIFDNPFI